MSHILHGFTDPKYLDVMIATNVQAGITTPGRICVPHAQLADAVRAVKPQDLTLTSDGARLVGRAVVDLP